MNRSTRYKVNPNVSVIRTSAQDIILTNMGKGREYHIPLDMFTLLSSFNLPVNVEQAISIYRNSNQQALEEAELLESIEELEKNDLIVLANVDVQMANSVAQSTNRFFNFNGMRMEEVINVGAHIPDAVAIIGMPFDHNVTNLPGSRLGPEYLRRHSRSIVPYGFPQVEVKGQHTEGIHLASKVFDCGDISGHVFDRNGRQQRQLEEIVRKLTLAKIKPVIVGGDHSITYSSLQGILSHKKIGLIHIDAHYDGGGTEQVSFKDIHHGNFMDGFLNERNLEHILQIGQRQRVDQEHVQAEKIDVVPSDELDISRYLREGLPYYITLDVDVLDPSFMSSTGTPVPLGMHPKELMAILTSIREHDIIGGDVVEFLPSEHKVHEALLVNELLLTLISMMTKVDLS